MDCNNVFKLNWRPTLRKTRYISQHLFLNISCWLLVDQDSACSGYFYIPLWTWHPKRQAHNLASTCEEFSSIIFFFLEFFCKLKDSNNNNNNNDNNNNYRRREEKSRLFSLLHHRCWARAYVLCMLRHRTLRVLGIIKYHWIPDFPILNRQSKITTTKIVFWNTTKPIGYSVVSYSSRCA